MSAIRPHEVVWTPERVGALWTYYGTNRAYDGQYFSAHAGRSVLAFVRKHIPLAGRRLVDFGCGPGFMLGHLLAEGIACEGLDFSEESVGAARRRFGAHPLFLGATTVGALPLPLADGSVDVMLLVEVVEHLLEDEFEATLREVTRVLATGGHAVVTVPHAEDLDAAKVMCPECGAIFHRWQHQRAFTSPALAATMEGLGLRTVIYRPIGFGPKQLGGSIRRLLGRLRGGDPPPHLVYIGQKP